MKNEKTPKERIWLGKKEVMQYLKISQRCLENWVNDGLLISYKLGGRIFFDQHELDEKISNSRNDKK